MNLSLEELKQRNLSTDSAEVLPTQPPQISQPCPLTQEKMDNLFYNQSVIWDGIAQLQEQVKSLQQQNRSLKIQLDNLPTKSELGQISKTLLQIQQALSQAGKQKEKSFSLPKLRLPHLTWTPLWIKAFRASIIEEVKAEIVAQTTETEKTIVEGIRESLVSPPKDGEEWSERKSYIEGDIITFKGEGFTATHYSRGKSPAEYPDLWKATPTEEAVKAWADIPDGTVIAEGEKVTQDGKTWVCKSQHIKSTVYKPKAGSSKWEEVVVGVRA